MLPLLILNFVNTLLLISVSILFNYLYRQVCVHGGLSPSCMLVSELENLDRFKEIPKHGPICDLTWSDPIDDSELVHLEENSDFDSVSNQCNFFLHNSIRGCSYFYTKNAIANFLNNNNLMSIIRAHQVQREGISLSKSYIYDPETLEPIGFPSLISIFSAPNYCDVYNNKGAIIKYSDNEFSIRIFNAAEHPFVLPNFQNAFTWSLPFLIEKFNDFIQFIFNQIFDEKAELEKIDGIAASHLHNKKKIKKKSSKFTKLKKFTKFRQNIKKNISTNRSELRLGSLTPNNRLRRKSSDADRELLNKLEMKGAQTFEDADNLDSLQYKIINSDEEIK